MSRVLQSSRQTKINDRNFIPSMATLARWRLRSTWLLLTLVGLGMTAAVTIVCAVPLFTTLAQNTNLQNALNASPATRELTLSASTQGLSTSVEDGVRQIFDQLARNTLGSYLSPSSETTVQAGGLRILAPAALGKLAPLNIYASSLADFKPSVHLLQGNWPRENGSGPEIDALLTPEEAQAMHVSIGSLLTLQGDFFTHPQDMLGGNNPDPATTIQVRLVGLFEPMGRNTLPLHGETFQATTNSDGTFYTLFLPTPALVAKLDQIAQSQHIDAVFSPLTFQSTTYYYLQTSRVQDSQVNDLVSRLSNFQVGVARALKNIQDQDQNQLNVSGTYPAPYMSQLLLYNSAPNTFVLLPLLNRYSNQIALVRIPLAVLALLILALVVFFVGLIAMLLVERQMSANALLSSRGASSQQIFWSLLLQGVALCLLALVLGPLLAIWIVIVLATRVPSINGQNVLAQVIGQPGHLFLTIGGYALCIALVMLLTMGMLLRGAAKLDVLALRREMARTSHRPAWMRYYFDIAAAVIALTGYGISLYLAGQARFLDLRTQSLILAPLALIAPTFLLIGGFLLFLRIFPLLLRLGARLSVRRKGATTMLVMVQMARAPRQALRMTMLLALATAFAIFTLVFSASQVQHTSNISAYESGADFSGSLPAALTQAAAHDNQALLDLTAQYQRIAGVNSATVGYLGQGTAANASVDIRAVDASTFGRTGYWNALNPSQSLSSLMHQLLKQRAEGEVGGFVPTIIDQTTQVNLGLNVGDQLSLSLTDVAPIGVECVVIAVVQHIPTVNDSRALVDSGTGNSASTGGILVDYATLDFAYQQAQQANQQAIGQSSQLSPPFPLPLNHIWLSTSDDSLSLAAVRAALNSPTLFLNGLYDRRELSAELQADPLYLNTLIILSIGVVTTLLLAVVGDLTASWLSVHSRLTSFTVLRALGATPRQIAAMLTWEQGLMYLTAIVLGVASGMILVLTTVPALIFTSVPVRGVMSQLSDTQFYVIQQIIPTQLVVPNSLNFVLIILIVICLAALALMVRTALRPSISQELRLSVD